MKIELSHDILAQKVYERVSLEDKRLREVERLVRERYAFYQGEPKLGPEEVDFVKPYLSKVDLTPEEQAFVTNSRRRIMARRRRRVLSIAAVVLAVIGGLGFYAVSVTQLNAEIEAEKVEAERARDSAAAARDAALLAQRRTDSALQEVERQRAVAVSNREEADQQRERAKRQARRAYEEAQRANEEAKRANNEAERASENAEEANRLRGVAEEKRLEALRLRDIAQQKARAANLLTAQSLANQSLKIQDDDPTSLRLKRLLAREAYRIHVQFRQDSSREWASQYDPQIYNALYDALAIADRDLNRVELSLAQTRRFQIRDLDRGAEHLYALASNGYLIRWNWDPQQRKLTDEQLLIQEGGSDIYFAQAISEADGLLSALGGMQGLRSFDLLANEPQTQRADLIAQVADDHSLLLGERLGDGHTRLYRKRHADRPTILDQDLIEIAATHNGHWLAARDQQGHLWAYRLDLADSLRIRQRHRVSNARFSRLYFRPGSSELVAGREDGSVERYVLLDLGNDDPVNRIEILRGHSARVSDLAFDPSRRFLASASFDGTVQVWDLQDDKHQRFGPLSIGVPGGLLQALSFVPSDTVLVTGDNQGNLRAWPVNPRHWYQQLEQQVSIGQVQLEAEEVKRYLGERAEIESSGLFDALPEYDQK